MEPSLLSNQDKRELVWDAGASVRHGSTADPLTHAFSLCSVALRSGWQLPNNPSRRRRFFLDSAPSICYHHREV